MTRSTAETFRRFVDPAQPLLAVAQLLSQKAVRAGVVFGVDIEPGVAPAPLDEAVVHAALTNLIANAIDACADGENAREHFVWASLREEASNIVYSVDGSGQPPAGGAVREVFFAARAVRRHGGRVSSTSVEGPGSHFQLEIPRDGASQWMT